MITLSPLENNEEKTYFYKKAGIEQNADSGCVKAADRDEVLGFCLYDLDKEKIVIRYIEPLSDLGLADGILRSTLHVAAERSIMKAYYSESCPEDIFDKLKFIKDKEEKSLDIDKLFKSCCNCGK